MKNKLLTAVMAMYIGCTPEQPIKVPEVVISEEDHNSTSEPEEIEYAKPRKTAIQETIDSLIKTFEQKLKNYPGTTVVIGNFALEDRYGVYFKFDTRKFCSPISGNYLFKGKFELEFFDVDVHEEYAVHYDSRTLQDHRVGEVEILHSVYKSDKYWKKGPIFPEAQKMYENLLDGVAKQMQQEMNGSVFNGELRLYNKDYMPISEELLKDYKTVMDKAEKRFHNKIPFFKIVSAIPCDY